MVDSGGSKRISSYFNVDFLKSSYKTLILVVFVAVFSIVGTSLVLTMDSNSNGDYFLSSDGKVQTLGVEAYSDQTCGIEIEKISWDVLEPGGTINTTLYIKSVSNAPIFLDVNLTDWEPMELSNYIMLSSDYKNQPLNPNDVIEVTIMLSASSSDEFVDYLVQNQIQNFSVNVHFFGSQ